MAKASNHPDLHKYILAALGAHLTWAAWVSVTLGSMDKRVAVLTHAVLKDQVAAAAEPPADYPTLGVPPVFAAPVPFAPFPAGKSRP